MRPTFLPAGLLVSAVAGLAGGCGSGPPGTVANPTYQAWAAFEPGSTVSLKGTRTVGQECRNVLITNRLVEVSAQQVVLERTVKGLDGNSQPPTITRKVEPARIDAEDNPRTNPQAHVTDLAEETIQIKDEAFHCKGTQVEIHAEFGGPLPTAEDVHLQTWVHPDVPGGTVKMFLVRKSVSHDLEVSAQAVDFKALRRKAP
jgi:hypothetical protein